MFSLSYLFSIEDDIFKDITHAYVYPWWEAVFLSSAMLGQIKREKIIGDCSVANCIIGRWESSSICLNPMNEYC